MSQSTTNNDPLYTLVAEIEPHYGATAKPIELNLILPEVTQVEGPYNDKDELLEYAELGETYFYYATLNVRASSVNPSEIKWAVAYDTEKFHEASNAPYYLFKGKEIVNNKIKISIGVGTTKTIKGKIQEKFRIYAYTETIVDNETYREVSIKNKFDKIYEGTKQWGKLQTGMPAKNKQLTEEELEKGLDLVGKANVSIMKWMDEDTIKGFYEKGPLGVKAVLSNRDDIENKVISNFYNGTLKKLSFDENSEQAKGLEGLSSFQDYFNDYLNVMEKFINEGTIASASAEEIMRAFRKLGGKSSPFPNFSNITEIASHDYYGLMGGTQIIKVELTVEHWTLENGKAVNFYKIYTKMHIGDWYGADWGDINGWESKLKGNVYSLNAFFWLQHHYGCHPFETEIIYESENKINI
jgi:hypothetical protein